MPTDTGNVRRALLLTAVAAAGWALVAAVMLCGVWIANLWLFAYAVYAFAFLIAGVCTICAVAALWRRHGPRWAVPVLVGCLLAPLGVYLVDWTWAFSHAFYRANRGGFADVAAMDARHEFNERDLYGQPLPGRLRRLSINGNAARIQAFDHDSGAVFLPAWEGIPDGAIGFAHLDPQTPRDARLDCFADPCAAQWSLGDGWYWLTRV